MFLRHPVFAGEVGFIHVRGNTGEEVVDDRLIVELLVVVLTVVTISGVRRDRPPVLIASRLLERGVEPLTGRCACQVVRGVTRTGKSERQVDRVLVRGQRGLDL